MKKRNMTGVAFAAGIVFMHAGCAIGPTSGVETTNGVTVMASLSVVKGTAPAHSSVSLFDTSYIPSLGYGVGRTMVTGANGEFLFDSLASGAYRLIVSKKGDSLAVSINITIDSATADTARDVSIKHTGSLSGVALSTQDSSLSMLVFLKGTPYHQILDSSGEFFFDAIPEGSYSLYITSIPGAGPVTIGSLLAQSSVRPVYVSSGNEYRADTLIVP